MRLPPLVLFKMKRKVGKGSIPHLLIGSNYTKTIQNFTYTSFSSVMFVRICAWFGEQAGFLCIVSFCVAVARKHGLV